MGHLIQVANHIDILNDQVMKNGSAEHASVNPTSVSNNHLAIETFKKDHQIWNAINTGYVHINI